MEDGGSSSKIKRKKDSGQNSKLPQSPPPVYIEDDVSISIEGDIDWKSERSTKHKKKLSSKEMKKIISDTDKISLENFRSDNLAGNMLLGKKRTIVISQSANRENCLFYSLVEWISNINFSISGKMDILNLPRMFRTYWERYGDCLLNKRLQIKTPYVKDELSLKTLLNNLILEHGDALFEAFSDLLAGDYKNANEMKERARQAGEVEFHPTFDLRGGMEHLILISLLCKTPVMIWQHYDEKFYEIYSDMSFVFHKDLSAWPDLKNVLEFREINNPNKIIIHLLYNVKEQIYERCSHYETLIVFD